ncbi:MAG TPA: DUF4440 domain-containing protein [Clostridia bacterium]
MKSIEKQILQLENELMSSEIRKSSQKVSELLSDDFFEFCSSGIEYHYKKGDIFQEMNDNSTLLCEIIDFKINELSAGCVLATYKLIKHSESNENMKYSLRSSIWKFYDKRWKIFFHQGTLTSQLRQE